MRRRRWIAPAAILFALGATAFAPDRGAGVAGPAPEPPQFKPLSSFQSQNPTGYETAWLDERVAVRGRPGGKVLARLGTKTSWGTPRILAVVKRRGDWLGVSTEARRNGRLGWIPASSARIGRVHDKLVADLSERTVRLYREGRLIVKSRVAIGRPSSPTPTGRFAVTDLLLVQDPASPYGCCVIALSGRQPHVPQGWRGGDRLAIHGTRQTSTIGRAASLGCLRATNRDMKRLFARVLEPGTPVFIKR